MSIQLYSMSIGYDAKVWVMRLEVVPGKAEG